MVATQSPTPCPPICPELGCEERKTPTGKFCEVHSAFQDEIGHCEGAECCNFFRLRRSGRLQRFCSRACKSRHDTRKHRSQNPEMWTEYNRRYRGKIRRQFRDGARKRSAKAWCSRCRRVLPGDAFPPCNTASTGRYGMCRDCRTKYNKSYYAANAEDRKRYSREWAAANPDRVERKRANHATTLENADPFAVTTYAKVWERFAYFGWRCWLCGDPVSVETVTREHVKPLTAGGLHVPANIRPACQSCNSSKNNQWPFDTAVRFRARPSESVLY